MKRNKSLANRYSFTQEEMSGGFGNVAICYDTHLERKVAIKSIINPQDKARLQDEIQALLSLRSKHVVQLYDVVTDESGEVCIVEEYIDGPDLIDLKDSIANEDDLINILWQIASGIEDIHKFDIVHRDIKPNNIKVDSEGIVKIYDFGLSRNIDNSSTIGFVGTPIFAAPELINGFGRVIFTTAVDVYAFGVTALCLCGIEPPPELKTIHKILKSNPFDNTKFTISDFLKNLFYRCLSVTADTRPKMTEVASYLRKEIVQGKHKAVLISNGRKHTLNKIQSSVSLSFRDIGSVEIKYNNFEFYISTMSGEVTINNRTPSINEVLPGACVITIGGLHRDNRDRAFITFDISHPEVVL